MNNRKRLTILAAGLAAMGTFGFGSASGPLDGSCTDVAGGSLCTSVDQNGSDVIVYGAYTGSGGGQSGAVVYAHCPEGTRAVSVTVAALNSPVNQEQQVPVAC